jgi:anti-sigma regulatory factor (Ser/Thr protein kinase)
MGDEVVRTVELLTSEVVTNALLHAHSAPELHVFVVEGVIRVEVCDRSTLAPIQRPVDGESASGRGMMIVEALAQSWGVDRLQDGGKQVWFEVAV